MKNVLENIKTIRELRGYTQDYLAELMGITQSAYARFERGATKTDLKTISLFAEALEMNIIDIITYPDKYVNSKEVNTQSISSEPEVVLQIKITGNKRDEMLRTVFGSCELEKI